MMALACCRCSIAEAISGAYARWLMRASVTSTPALPSRSWTSTRSPFDTSAVWVRERHLAVAVRVVRVARGQRAHRRLALHPHVVLVVVHLEHRLGGVDDLPHHDRRDLDRVAVGVVHLELRGLEVPHPERDLLLRDERVDPPEPRAPSRCRRTCRTASGPAASFGFTTKSPREAEDRGDEEQHEPPRTCRGGWRCCRR